MQKKIRLSAQLKKKLIQKIGIQKEIFDDFSNELKNIDNKKDIEKISKIQKEFFGNIEKKINDTMMDFAKKGDFKYAAFLRDLLFEFQNEIKAEQKFSDDLKKIFGGEIKNISCFGESENFVSIIKFEDGLYQKSNNKIFEKNKNNPSKIDENNLEEIFEKNLKILEKKIKNEKEIKSGFIYKKLNKKDFEKIFKKIYGKNFKDNLENFFGKEEEIFKENEIKINYFGYFKKEKFDEKKLENNFIGIIPVWKYDNKSYEIIFENNEFLNNIFGDFIAFLGNNFSEKDFYIYGNSEKYEKLLPEFGIKKIKTLKGKLFSEDFGIIPENIGKLGPNKNKTEGFFGKFTTGKKEEKTKIPDLFLIDSNKIESEIFLQDKKIFTANKKFLKENEKKFGEGIKFLNKIFDESMRILKKQEKILKENHILNNY